MLHEITSNGYVNAHKPSRPTSPKQKPEQPCTDGTSAPTPNLPLRSSVEPPTSPTLRSRRANLLWPNSRWPSPMSTPMQQRTTYWKRSETRWPKASEAGIRKCSETRQSDCRWGSTARRRCTPSCRCRQPDRDLEHLLYEELPERECSVRWTVPFETVIDAVDWANRSAEPAPPTPRLGVIMRYANGGLTSHTSPVPVRGSERSCQRLSLGSDGQAAEEALSVVIGPRRDVDCAAVLGLVSRQWVLG